MTELPFPYGDPRLADRITLSGEHAGEINDRFVDLERRFKHSEECRNIQSKSITRLLHQLQKMQTALDTVRKDRNKLYDELETLTETPEDPARPRLHVVGFDPASKDGDKTVVALSYGCWPVFVLDIDAEAQEPGIPVTESLQERNDNQAETIEWLRSGLDNLQKKLETSEALAKDYRRRVKEATSRRDEWQRQYQSTYASLRSLTRKHRVATDALAEIAKPIVHEGHMDDLPDTIKKRAWTRKRLADQAIRKIGETE